VAAVSDRPANGCLTHRPPKADRPWRLSDPGYRTCRECCDQLHRWLTPGSRDDAGRPDSIPELYLLLNPLPVVSDSGRRGPGFGSRSPATDHIIAMRDRRSVKVEAGDPHSVPAVLASWARMIAEDRDVTPPAATVPDLCAFLDRHLDWVTRQDWVDELADELRELHAQLRGAVGDGRQAPLGHCIEPLDGRDCGAPIYMPAGTKPRAPDEPIKDLPSLQCGACGAVYDGRRLILLRLANERKTA
jgi:hypothetical protein